MSMTKEQFAEMMALQFKMNAVVNPEWRTAGYNWTDAILVESVEAIEHYGWKWWKKQDTDIEQVKMELVDIWHLALSFAMSCGHVEYGQDVDDVVEELWLIIEELEKEEVLNFMRSSGLDFIGFMRKLAGVASTNNFDISYFAGAMDNIGMSFGELYEMYIAKNALNMFRQANGYKDGTYVKDWSRIGYKEDNGYLVDALAGYK